MAPDEHASAMADIEARIARLTAEKRAAYAEWQALGFLMRDLYTLAHVPGADADLRWAYAMGDEVEVRNKWRKRGHGRGTRVTVDAGQLLALIRLLRRVEAEIGVAKSERWRLARARPAQAQLT
jgi:hypothetical protein